MKQKKSDVWVFLVSGTCVVLRKDLEWDLENTVKIQETIRSGMNLLECMGANSKMIGIVWVNSKKRVPVAENLI